MKLYKILVKEENGDYVSPFQSFNYGKLNDFLGKEMVSKFDTSNEECSYGFYATEIQGLIYTNLSRRGSVVFECEMSGDNKKFSDYKWRWEKQIFVRELTEIELHELVKTQSEKMDWNYYAMLFPLNPLSVRADVTEKHLQLLKIWASVWDSVRASVRASVGDSVRDSVWDSVRDSVRAYMSYGFPNIKKWKYIDHEEGVSPFQSCIDLWNDGLVPSFDGGIWRLHTGSNAEIVFSISKKELLNYK